MPTHRRSEPQLFINLRFVRVNVVKIAKLILGTIPLVALWGLALHLSFALHAVLLARLSGVAFLVAFWWWFDRIQGEGEPVFLRLGADRLVRWHMGWFQSLRFRDITGFEPQDDGTVLAHTKRRPVRLDRHILNQANLVRQLRGVTGLADEEATIAEGVDVTLPADTINLWLNLRPGEQLRVKLRPWLAAAGVFGLLGGLVAVAIGRFVATHDPWMLTYCAMAIGFALFATPRMAARDTTVYEVRATGEALEFKCLHCWRKVAWGAIRSVTTLPYDLVQVSTSSGDYMLGPGSGRGRLMAAMQKAITARSAGEVLPRMNEESIPAGAISPVVGSANLAAISRVSEG